MTAFIKGEPADFAAALERATLLLRACRHPLIAGLATDVAGARVALRLAARLRGVADHCASPSLMSDIRAQQDAGAMFTTPAQASRHADLVLLLGPGPARPGWLEAMFTDEAAAANRDLIWLCSEGRPLPGGVADPDGALRIDADAAELQAMIGVLRARINARPVSGEGCALEDAARCLRQARFGVAVFDPADLDALAVENLYGLVRELNAAARFSVLRYPGDDNAGGVNEVAIWTTGGPLPVGFGRARPEHDPWRFAADRLVRSGEVDAALWIAALRPAWPAWLGTVPTVGLIGGADAPAALDVAIEVGTPGVDHDAILLDHRIGALAHVAAAAPSSRPSVAQVLERIEAGLGDAAGPC